MFNQTGGINSTTFMSITSYGGYKLTGGTLQVNGAFANQGVFDGGNSPATLAAASILDLSSGTWQNLKATTLTMGPSSLVIVPAGFDLSTGVAANSTFNLTYTLGTTLVVPAGKGFAGFTTINDPVNCQGTIDAGAGAINLLGGLTLSGTGQINLGYGTITTNDATSTMSGGSLSMGEHYVGYGGTGSFTQSGGTKTSGYDLYLGYNSTDSGSYALSGGSLTTSTLTVGCSGMGTFTQSGGSSTIGGGLSLGANSGSSGIYNLSGGQLSAFSESVGTTAGGTGLFNQSGGFNGPPRSPSQAAHDTR